MVDGVKSDINVRVDVAIYIDGQVKVECYFWEFWRVVSASVFNYDCVLSRTLIWIWPVFALSGTYLGGVWGDSFEPPFSERVPPAQLRIAWYILHTPVRADIPEIFVRNSGATCAPVWMDMHVLILAGCAYIWAGIMTGTQRTQSIVTIVHMDPLYDKCHMCPNYRFPPKIRVNRTPLWEILHTPLST